MRTPEDQFDDQSLLPGSEPGDEMAVSVRRGAARRSVWVFGLLALGMMLARWVNGPDGWSGGMVPAWACFVVGGALAACGGMTRGRWCKALLAAGVIALGMGWWTMRIAESPGHGLARLLAAATAEGSGNETEPLVTAVEGVVMEPAELVGRREDGGRGALGAYAIAHPATRLRVSISGVAVAGGMLRSIGRVDAYVSGSGSLDIRAGERVRLIGELEPIGPPVFPGQTDARLFAAQDGVAGRMRVGSAAMVERLSDGGSFDERLTAWRVRALVAARARASRALGLVDDEKSRGGALLGALLLGQRDPALTDVSSAFQRLGLLHLVAISGFNMIVLAGVGLWLLRLTGDRGWVEPALVALMISAYLLILPVSAPVLRAGLMVLAFLAAESAGRRYDRLSVMGWIGVGLILWRPMDLWNIGFQLSFGIVAALLWLGEAWRDRLFTPRLKGTLPEPIGERPWWVLMGRSASRRFGDALKNMLASSLLAWAVALPIVAQHVGVVSPLAVLTTLVVLPLTTLVMVAGYVVLIVGTLVPALGSACGGALMWLGDALVWVVTTLDDVPGLTLRVPTLNPAWAACALVVIVYWLRGPGGADLQIGVWAKQARKIAWACATALVVAWLGAQVRSATPGGGSGLTRGVRVRIDTLAVGDGACHLVRARADGEGRAGAMLWDCGSLSPNIGVRRIPDAVRALGAWRVRDVLITHANFDHYSGVLDVVEPLGVERVWLTHAFIAAAEQSPRGAAAALLEGLRERGVEVRVIAAGDEIGLARDEHGSASLRVLWPPPTYVPVLTGDVPDDEAQQGYVDNDSSLLARLELRRNSEQAVTPAALFTGDVGPTAIEAIIGGDDAVSAPWMEAPHHGSAKPKAMELMRLVDPRVVAQSTGPRRVNDARWAKLREGRVWRTTATNGSVWYELLDDGTIKTGAMLR